MRSQVESSLRPLIQSKRRKFIIKVSIISSQKISLSRELGFWSPWHVSRFFSVQIHEPIGSEISRFPFFTVLDSGDNVNARLGCGNEMIYVPQIKERFPCCAIRWMQFILYSTLSSSFFVSTCSNKHSQFTRWVYLTSHERNRKPLHLLKEIVKSEPENKVDTKQKKQVEELQRESGTKVRIEALIDWKEIEEGCGVTFTTN